MGGLVGPGYQAAMGFGLRTMGQAVLLVVMAFFIYEAVLRSAKLRCDGPMEAVLGMFRFAFDHLGKMATAPHGRHAAARRHSWRRCGGKGDSQVEMTGD